MALIAQNFFLPLVDITLVSSVGRTEGEDSALPVALLVGRLANTLSTVGSVTV